MKLLVLLSTFVLLNGALAEETVATTTAAAVEDNQSSTVAPVVKPGVAYETPEPSVDVAANEGVVSNQNGNMDKLNPNPANIPVEPVKPADNTGNVNQPLVPVPPQEPVNPLPVSPNFHEQIPQLHGNFNPYQQPGLNQIPQQYPVHNFISINPYGYNGYNGYHGLNARPVFGGYHPGLSFIPSHHGYQPYQQHFGHQQYNPYISGPFFGGHFPAHNFINTHPVVPVNEKTPEVSVNQEKPGTDQQTQTSAKINPVVAPDNVNPIPAETLPLNQGQDKGSANPDPVQPNPETVKGEKAMENPASSTNPEQPKEDPITASGSSNVFSIDDELKGVESQVKRGFRGFRDFERPIFSVY